MSYQPKSQHRPPSHWDLLAHIGKRENSLTNDSLEPRTKRIRMLGEGLKQKNPSLP